MTENFRRPEVPIEQILRRAYLVRGLHRGDDSETRFRHLLERLELALQERAAGHVSAPGTGWHDA